MPVTCLLACLTCSGAASCQGGRGRRKSLQIPDPQPSTAPPHRQLNPQVHAYPTCSLACLWPHALLGP